VSESSDDEIPAVARPKPEEAGYDLEAALSSVVSLRVEVPADAFTAETLGTERRGNGIVIGDKGLVLTIGYLVIEAEQVWITTGRGTVAAGHVLAYDQATGFGLVQALGRLGAPAMRIGPSGALEEGTPVVVAGSRGLRTALSARIVGRRPFAGYWEYYLEEALFTAPAHPHWGGAAVIGPDGRLVGVGSLLVQEAAAAQSGARQASPASVVGNMAVPADLLATVLDDLLRRGRSRAADRPWLGLYATDVRDAVVVTGTAPGGPAAEAGLAEGDIVLRIDGHGIEDLGDLWRRLWAAGPPGVSVRLVVARDGEAREVGLRTVDRHAFLKQPRLH
jgi:S1-C subfamily serine protease